MLQRVCSHFQSASQQIAVISLSLSTRSRVVCPLRERVPRVKCTQTLAVEDGATAASRAKLQSLVEVNHTSVSSSSEILILNLTFRSLVIRLALTFERLSLERVLRSRLE